jgi:dihydroorotate dehydrogenase electron transfer subunit
MNDFEARVVENRRVADGTWLMSLECGLASSDPGQFVMAKISDSQEPFLRRPFAILSHRPPLLELLYKLKGKGTHEMSKKEKGDPLWILGPLGNGFTLPGEDDPVVYVAGGTGLPPILALAGKVGRGSLVIGARSASDLPLMDRMSALPGITVLPVTEDGSLGAKGLATDALSSLLALETRPCAVYACGPTGMLKKACDLASDAGARCQVSLEEYMACGFGVCSACAVKTTSGIMRVCAQGPVFDAGIIQWSW